MKGSTLRRMEEEGWRLGETRLLNVEEKKAPAAVGRTEGRPEAAALSPGAADARAKALAGKRLYIDGPSRSLARQLRFNSHLMSRRNCIHCVKYLFVACINSYIFPIYLTVNGYCNAT